MKGYFEKMKKFVLAFGIPVLAVASLIGSGYATWFFNNIVNPDSINITIKPEEKKVVGAKFQQGGENFKLVLDQTDKSDTDGMPAGRMGVHFEGAFSESLIADADGDLNTHDTFVNETSYIVTTTINIPSEVAKYVNFTLRGQLNKDQPDDQTSSTTKLTLTKQYKLTVDGDAKEKFDEFFKISSDLRNTNVTVAYAQEPSISAEYDDMKAAVSGKTIDISFKAEIDVA